MIIYYLSLSK